MGRKQCPHCPATRANEDELDRHIRSHIADLASFVDDGGQE